MIEFLSDYGLFLAKAVTIVIAILMIIAVAAATAQSRQRRDHKGEIQVTPLNDFFEDLRDALGVEHDLHIRKILTSRDKLKPLSQQEKAMVGEVKSEFDAAAKRGDMDAFAPSSKGDIGEGADLQRKLDPGVVFSQVRM